MSGGLASLAESPSSTGLFFDFDGTLSEVAERAEDARPVEGAVDLLDALARKFAVVAVVSGRDAGQLLEWLESDIEIWGAHGAQRALHGKVEIADELQPFTEEMSHVLDRARAEVERMDIAGIRVEDKTVIVGIHYRPAMDRVAAKEAVEALAQDLCAEFGVTWSPSKMAVELKPPIELSKKKVVLQRAREAELRCASYTGDDVVDLAAFDALDRLGDEGVNVLRVAVDSPEAPIELTERADLVLEGPRGVVEAFGSLI